MSNYVHIWLYSLPKKHPFFLLPILFCVHIFLHLNYMHQEKMTRSPTLAILGNKLQDTPHIFFFFKPMMSLKWAYVKN